MIIVRIIFLICSLFFGLLDAFDIGYVRIYFMCFSIIAYVIIECMNLRYKEKANYFVKPIILFNYFIFVSHLGAFFTFTMVENQRTIISHSDLQIAEFVSEEVYLKTLFCINLACLAAWIGYSLKTGRSLFENFTRIKLYRKLIYSDVDTNKLILLNYFAYAIKFYLFSISLYGRLLSSEYFDADSGFKQGSELRVLSDLSFLTLFLIAFKYFKNPQRKLGIIFLFSFVVELLFGSMYAARSSFLYPFIIVFIAEILAKEKFTKKWLMVFPVVIGIAFTFILDFKNYALGAEFIKSSNPIEQLETFLDVKNATAPTESTITTGILSYLETAGHNEVLAMAVNFADNGELTAGNAGDPDFIFSFLRVPFDAVVPKFVQGEKEFVWGLWFKNTVLKHAVDLKYSISMTPVGFLYMTGGIFAVFFGFLIQGMVLKFVDTFLLLQADFAKVYFILLSYLAVQFDAITSNYLTTFIRYCFLFPIIFWFLLRKKNSGIRQ